MHFAGRRHRILRHDAATPCLKEGYQLQSTLYPCVESKAFFRWWSGERKRDGVSGDTALL